MKLYKSVKRATTTVLAACMIGCEITAVPAMGQLTVLAAETAADFQIQDGVLVKYNGSEANVTIPASVTTIGTEAFKGNKSVVSVTISDSVTEIGLSAFSGCENLESITLSKNLARIGENAFKNCTKLNNVTIPKSVNYVYDQWDNI